MSFELQSAKESFKLHIFHLEIKLYEMILEYTFNFKRPDAFHIVSYIGSGSGYDTELSTVKLILLKALQAVHKDFIELICAS